MSDNVAITAGAGTTIATDDVGGGVQVQRAKVTWGPDGTANDTDTASGKPLPVQLRNSSGTELIKLEDDTMPDQTPGIVALVKRNDTPANTSGTDGDAEFLQVSGGFLWVRGTNKFVTVSNDITRDSSTTLYTANDALSDSTSTPTTGGFTFTNAARASGGSGIITDAIVASSADAGTPLQGEVWIFDTAVTAITDNSVFAVSDAEIKTLVGVIPFTLTDSGNNDSAWVSNLDMGFTCVGSANLRYLIRVKNGYTPVASEVITVRLKIIQVD